MPYAKTPQLDWTGPAARPEKYWSSVYPNGGSGMVISRAPEDFIPTPKELTFSPGGGGGGGGDAEPRYGFGYSSSG